MAAATPKAPLDGRLPLLGFAAGLTDINPRAETPFLERRGNFAGSENLADNADNVSGLRQIAVHAGLPTFGNGDPTQYSVSYISMTKADMTTTDLNLVCRWCDAIRAGLKSLTLCLVFWNQIIAYDCFCDRSFVARSIGSSPLFGGDRPTTVL
jgi:hypothetical protein